MKGDKQSKLLIISLLLLSGVLSVLNVKAQIRNEYPSEIENSLQLEIASLKKEYLLGELVFLNFKVINKTSTDIRVKGVDLDSRYIQVFIAASDKKFRQYLHARVRDKGGILRAGQIVESTSGILWNFVPPYSNPEAFKETLIQTSYAFPEAGVYWVKAKLFIPSENRTIKIESKPIQIPINKPGGEDLEVWNKIKDKGDIAYFIQEAELRVPDYKPEEQAKAKQEIEQIIAQHPNSLLSNQLKQSLIKFYKTKEKLKLPQ